VVTVVDAKNKSFITNIPVFTPNLAPNGSVAPEPDMSFHTVAADPVTGYVYVPAATGVRVFAATTGATVPSAHTGEPWSGPLYWVLAAGAAALGYAMFEVGRRRRKANSTV
jgi:DNA-binding beta-propeller fold protein YncE